MLALSNSNMDQITARVSRLIGSMGMADIMLALQKFPMSAATGFWRGWIVITILIGILAIIMTATSNSADSLAVLSR
jgi:hypothetical protein